MIPRPPARVLHALASAVLALLLASATRAPASTGPRPPIRPVLACPPSPTTSAPPQPGSHRGRGFHPGHRLHDYRTRRIGRAEPSGATAITFTGGLALAEYGFAHLELETLNSQTPTVEYRRGPDMGGGIGGLLYSLRGGQPKFNLINGRGDIVAQSDAAAALTWTASYEAFGKRPEESRQLAGAGIDHPVHRDGPEGFSPMRRVCNQTGSNAGRQRANSKEEDPTGLLIEHFRYRDLETGVWLSRDHRKLTRQRAILTRKSSISINTRLLSHSPSMIGS